MEATSTARLGGSEGKGYEEAIGDLPRFVTHAVDDGAALQLADVLALVDAAKDEGTSLGVGVTQVEREDTAVDDVLLGQAVDNQAVRLVGLPAGAQVGGQAQDAISDPIALGDHAEGLVEHDARAHGNGIAVVGDLGAGLGVRGRGVTVVELAAAKGADGRGAAVARVVLARSSALLGLRGGRSGAAVGVDPELRGTCVEKDSNLLTRIADLD